MSEKKRICKNCEYWAPIISKAPETGQCRRYALEPGCNTWPYTCRDFFCGEFARKGGEVSGLIVIPDPLPKPSLFSRIVRWFTVSTWKELALLSEEARYHIRAGRDYWRKACDEQSKECDRLQERAQALETKMEKLTENRDQWRARAIEAERVIEVLPIIEAATKRQKKELETLQRMATKLQEQVYALLRKQRGETAEERGAPNE